jgi:small redox-active disulfide protein 2
MKHIKVLGSGCANCATTTRLIQEFADQESISITLEKIEDIGEIMSHGVMSTPGVIVDDKLVHAGGIPDKNSIKAWLLG